MKKAKKDESACLAFKLPTLLQAIDSVAQLSNDSQLSDEFFMKALPEIGLLADAYGITERQAVIFSVCLLHGPYRVDFGDLARHLDLSTIGVLSLANDIDMLVRRRLLRYRDAKDKDQFDIPRPVLNALKRNEPYESPTLIGLDKYQLFEVINEMFNDLEGGSLTPSNAVAELRTARWPLFNTSQSSTLRITTIGYCSCGCATGRWVATMTTSGCVSWKTCMKHGAHSMPKSRNCDKVSIAS